MTITEFRAKIRDTGRTVEDMTTDEAAQSLRLIRDELYANKFLANPVMVSHILDVAWLLSSPDAKKQWEIDANKAIKEMEHESAVLIGRKGGQAKSDRKAASSRVNGQKGGRPRKEKK